MAAGKAMEKRDLVIVGGGVGGLVVASVTSRLGLKVTLVEAQENRLGGDCLYYGCVPSKALIHAARLVHQARRASEFGLKGWTVGPVDFPSVMSHVNGVIERLQEYDDPERFRAYGCEVVFGKPRFVAPDTIALGDRSIKARRFVVATGSAPFVPDISGLKEAGFLTNREAFELSRLPSRLAVLGAGPIGIELAQAFSRLGSEVTVIQQKDRILPREERQVSGLLQSLLSAEGIEFRLGAEVSAVQRRGEGRLILGRSESGDFELEADELLVATGRRPNVEGLGLEAAGVKYGRSGILVNSRLRSSNPRVFACGDVCGPFQFTHMAEYQAGVVIANIAFRLPQKVDYRVVPWVTFTDPEVARVGLTEAEAAEQGIETTVMEFPFKDVDRAVIEWEAEGFAKLVVRKGARLRAGGRILGATVVGAHAGEMLHEIVLAMGSGLGIKEISKTIHAYPTRAQVTRRTVNSFYAEKLFSPAAKRLVRWINAILR